MAKKIATVYKATNLLNGKIYIGKHMSPAGDPLHETYLGSGIGIGRAIKKYGVHAFSKELLMICNSEEDAFKLESELVTADFIAKTDNYNGVVGGAGLTTEYIKEELARRYSCPVYSAKHADTMREVMSRPEVRESISKAHLALQSDPLHVEKMKKAYAGKERSEKLSKASIAYHKKNPEASKEAATRRGKNGTWINNITKSNQDQAKDPKWIKAHAEAQKKMREGDDWAIAHRKGIAERSNNEEWLTNVRKAGKRRSADPVWRKMMTDRNKAMRDDPKWREAIRLARNTEEYKKSASVRAKAQWADVEAKKIRVDAMRERHANEAFKKKHSEQASKANSIPIIAHGIVYNRMQDAAEALGISMYKLRKILKTGSDNIGLHAT